MRRMWRERNAGRGGRSTLLLAVAIALIIPSPARGDETRPDIAGAVEAMIALRGWLDAWDLPGPRDGAGRLPIERAAAVAVTLHLGGRTFGSATDSTGDDEMVRRAAARAMGRALATARELAGGGGEPDLAGRLVVELEVAGPMLPVLGGTWEAVADRLEPGMDGVALRRGDAWAVRFPSQLRATNSAHRVESILPGLAADVGLEPRSLRELRAAVELDVYRFRVVHLVQVPDDVPSLLTRGDIPVPATAGSNAGIRALADGIAMHLESRLFPAGDTQARPPLGITGTYRTIADEYSPIVAPPMDQALAAFSLYVHAGAADDTNAAERSRRIAFDILLDLETVIAGEEPPTDDPLAAGAIMIAALAGPGGLEDPGPPRLFAAAAERVRASWSPEGFTGASGSVLEPHGQALLALAMARAARCPRLDIEPETARAILEHVWALAPAARQVQLMPWVAMAERELAAATGLPIAHADALARLCAAVGAGQIDGAPGGDAFDLAGGYILTSGPRPTATAQSARAAAAVAVILGLEGVLSPDARDAAAASLRSAMRFLTQLSIRPEHSWWLRRPRVALGGIRSGPGDADLVPAAQAVALLAAAEALAGLD